MKTFRTTSWIILLLLSLGLNLSSTLETSAQQKVPRSARTLTLESGGRVYELPLVPEPPQSGTFFSLQLTNLPPLPFRPLDFPVYSMGDAFLFNDLGFDWTGVSLFGGYGGQMMTAAEGPPTPGDEGSGGGGSSTNNFPPAYSAPGLKLTAPMFTNSVMNFSLMESDTNWVYDVYWSPVIPTNRWKLIAQTSFQSTNFSLPQLTNDMAFFQLGTLTDSDGDSLPDAFEILITGTSPSLADSDSDLIFDADEDHDGNGIPNLVEYLRVTVAGVFASLPKAYEGGSYGEFTFFLPKPAVTNNTPLEFFLGGNVEPDFDFTLTTPSGVPESNTVYFAAGTSFATLRVAATNDTEQAAHEKFVAATVTNYSGGYWDSRMALVNLIDNDPPMVSVSAVEPIAVEPAGVTNNGIFRFARAGSNTSSLNLTFSLSGNTTNGADYNLISTFVNFPAGTNFMDVVIAPKTNGVFNGSREVTATIFANAAYNIAPGNSAATILITESDLPVVQVTAADSDARESGLNPGKFSLWRSGNTSAPLVVSVGVSGSADEEDYSLQTNYFVIPPGMNRLDVTVTPISDTLTEASETVVMTLKGNENYAIGITNSATVFIDDSHATVYSWDLPKQASAYHTTPVAIDSPAIVEVYRTGSCRLAANFPYQIYDGSTLDMSLMRVYGDVVGQQVHFAANASVARIYLTDATPNQTTGGGSFLISSLFQASAFPIHFLAANRYVKISIIQTNAIEGTATKGRLRATRLATGVALNIPFSTNHPPYSTNGGTALPSHYTLSSDGYNRNYITLGSSDTTGDLDITANTTGALEGWRSLILSVFLKDSSVAYDVPSQFLTYLRDNVSNPETLPEPDSDRDGLSDRWEQAHGLDPLLANDPNADPDRNGLGLLDEYQQGLNPAGDPGPDYLPIKLRVADSGKVNNGSSCAVCHTTEMRVNDFRFYASTPRTREPISAEKIFYFLKGTNYPVSLAEVVNNIPRPNNDTGNPTTSEKYSAQFLASSNELPAQFFITDAQSRLGSNKTWTTSFPLPTQNPVATLTVPRIDITFTNLPGNTPLDVNSNWNGGLRVFPDQISPTDNTARNFVKVRVTTTPKMPGKQVRLKSFDVDDATPTKLDGGFLIDTNDASIVKGNDNRGTPQAGTLAQTLLTLDGNGAAETQLTLPMQPGDNLRVAALFETNNAQTHLDSLQVTNANAVLYVTNSDDPIKGFLGSLSPMLTVWRKLHVEFDSMEAPPQTGDQINFWPVTITGRQVFVNQTNLARLTVRGPFQNNSFNRFENGTLSIPNVGDYEIAYSLNDFGTAPGPSTFNYLAVSTGVTTNVIGLNATAYDDDDRFLSTIGLPPALPKDDESASIVQVIRPVYLPAYIEITNANAEGFNATKRIAFKRNAYMESILGVATGAGVYDDAKGLHDRENFWSHTVTFGYQAETSDDGDPNKEGTLLGVTLKKSVLLEGGVTAIFVETIRDIAIDRVIANQNLSQFYPNYRREYTNWISGIVAHEIGRAPGSQSQGADHDEDGLMNKNGQPITTFSPKTIKRFRAASSWSN